MKYYITFLLILALAACVTPKNGGETGLPGVSPIFRNGADTVMSADSAAERPIAELPWAVFLTDTTLKALIDTALVRNNDLQSAVKDIEIADQLYRQSRLGYLPGVEAGITSSNSLPSKNSLNGLTASQFLGTKDLNDYKASVGLSWEADIWGKIKNQRGLALAQYLQTQEGRKGIQTRLVASIAEGYYNLLMLDKQLSIARANLLLNDSTLAILHLQYASAQVTSLALQQEEVQKLAVAELIPQLEREINIQENALSVLTGVIPQAVSRASRLEKVVIPAQLTTGLPSAMVSRRPDVHISELELQAASARIGIARANLYPSLTLSATGGVNSLRTSDWFNIPASLFGIVAGGLTQPVFQRRELRTQYDIAVLRREQSVFRFRQSVLAAFREVSDALVRIEKLGQQHGITTARVDELHQAVANANLLFTTGMANYLEVLTAQRNALSGELELAMVERDRLDAAVELYRSLGGGWNQAMKQ